ncbi:MAG TPA: hypothetical protein VFK56_03880 [Mycobacterium sp.]|nr:hypothetical protein [Mycobacterium sp.]
MSVITTYPADPTGPSVSTFTTECTAVLKSMMSYRPLACAYDSI